MHKKIILIFAVVGLLFFGGQALSAGFGLKDTATKAGYETTGASSSITGRIQSIVSTVLGIVAILFFALTLYGGFTWLTARGKEDKVAEAKGILEAAIIGLVIIAASYAITTFILSRVAGKSSCLFSDGSCGAILSEEEKTYCSDGGGEVISGPCP
ncbi:MAG: hypothetical protein NTW66_01365 [Candidatus Magasanikbacteria bacterium]|nr:hypothetical protein [Candidatus Magasanikbacteria bacterium]